jgi:hypothetical protein
LHGALERPREESAMSEEKDRERDDEKKPQPGQEDQLNPSRALREPLAKPTVSFPEDPDDGC